MKGIKRTIGLIAALLAGLALMIIGAVYAGSPNGSFKWAVLALFGLLLFISALGWSRKSPPKSNGK